MGAELPDGCATHAETADEQAVVIEGVGLAGMLVGLPEVDFAGELVGAAVTAVGMQDVAVVGRNLADGLPAILQEVQLAQVLAPAVAPKSSRSGPAPAFSGTTMP